MTRRWNIEWRLYSKNLGIWDVGTVDLWRRLELSLSHTSEDGCSPEGEREPRAQRETVPEEQAVGSRHVWIFYMSLS